MLSEQEKLEQIARLGIDLHQIQDQDILMETILTKARHFVNADGSSIYICQDGGLSFACGQNDTLQRRLPDGENLKFLARSLPINEESIVGYVASTAEVLNLSDAYSIDPAAPYKIDKSFDAENQYRTTSILTIPLTNPIGNVLGALQVINRQDEEKRTVPFSEDDVMLMMSFAGIAAVSLERTQLTRTLVLRIVQVAALRDPKETGAHVNRVAGYAVELFERWAKAQGISEKEIARRRDELRMAAMLHDAGKVAIPDSILKKPGRLNKEEYETMKDHSVCGARLFADRQSSFDEAAMVVTLNHHERWDGNGYPGFIDVDTGEPLDGYKDPDGTARGKKGAEIPIYGRIVALSDVFDALSSACVYKEAWKEEDVLRTIEGESGAQFDPTLVKIFFNSLDALRAIQDRYAEGT
jgi:HD-GYP domain-containing protein (c-di-GMP phosphodiesterase class II)